MLFGCKPDDLVSNRGSRLKNFSGSGRAKARQRMRLRQQELANAHLSAGLRLLKKISDSGNAAS
jgi:hypothetical protein